ncbi:hypothetical protein AJ79_05545 [Helicocarpus griseus UAMH5409]|uniref:CWF21 domain-containing protein n=1 Tax=Helicocarpus griseus UAMH5409 TaxID=1447875 RepID=A0A2B7XLV4_9EURO|nr:hypothetical protein AJ79_05545 [Helicocarpus griseus UAMH5409]
MSSNVGLSTPRGSGTSGYVQRNLSHLKPRDAPYPPPLSSSNQQSGANGFRQRKPDKQILDHDRRRAIEVKILEERDRLEEENEELEEDKRVSEEEIENRLEVLREKLVGELERDMAGGVGGDRRDGKGGKKQFKTYQVHELAEAKIEESERLRRALGIRGEGKEGDEWRWGRDKDGGRRERDGDRGDEREKDRGRDRERDRDGYRGRSGRDW